MKAEKAEVQLSGRALAWLGRCCVSFPARQGTEGGDENCVTTLDCRTQDCTCETYPHPRFPLPNLDKGELS
jgi:hypothetical protein